MMNKNACFIFAVISILLVLNTPILCSTQSSDQTQNEIKLETLSFQKAHIAQVYPHIEKQIEVNFTEISKYISQQDQAKIMGNFLLQYKSVVRSAEIHISIFTKSQNKDGIESKNFSLFDHSQFQETTIFKLDFFSELKFNNIQKIVIHIKANQFSVVSLALLNNELPFEIDLAPQKDGQHKSFGLIPVWLPFSYDPQNEKVKQKMQYIFFRAEQNPTKLRINRIKGHPKVFLYNCQTDRINFCKDQIKDQHVEGTLMFQKEIEVSFKKQPHCKDCLIMLAFKNLGAETSIQITEHSGHESLVISKDLPIYYDLKRSTSLDVISYYNLHRQQERNEHFLDFSFVQSNSSSVKLQSISINQLTKLTGSQNLSSKEFLMENRTNAIRIKLSSNFILKTSTDQEDNSKQIWYKITFRIVSETHAYFSVVDRNIPFNQENFITLKDGQIFHSYIFDNLDLKHTDQESEQVFQVQNFKVKVPSISTLTIITSCTEFNRLQIQFFANPLKITRINPKVYVQNITNHNKKCSQLIHLNPKNLFTQNQNDQSEGKQNTVTTLNEKGCWVYVRLTGIKDEVDLLYSSSDMIMLEKEFPYHAQIQHDQHLYFQVANIKNQARIKITKCSDCHLSIRYSEEQIADLKTKRSEEIITKDLNAISNVLTYQMKGKHRLYIQLKTNNYAHFVVTVEDVIDEPEGQVVNAQETNNRITFSLQDDDKLVLEFSLPEFIYTNNLNSPIHFSLIEGSIHVQVSREIYCPEFIFTEKQKTRDVSISQIVPELTHDEAGNQKMKFVMELKHHDFFGIRAQKGNQIFSYKVVNIESMKEFAQNRLSIFNVVLFLTFALFMSFVCFMGLKRKRVKKIGGEVILEQTDGEQTSMIRLN